VAERTYISIGQVLDLLKREFPDLTISKIRFLESQGLLDPERTPSGYRKFYEGDIERLRFILKEQQDNYLPLKVIKGRLGSEPGTDADIGLGLVGATAPGAPGTARTGGATGRPGMASSGRAVEAGSRGGNGIGEAAARHPAAGEPGGAPGRAGPAMRPTDSDPPGRPAAPVVARPGPPADALAGRPGSTGPATPAHGSTARSGAEPRAAVPVPADDRRPVALAAPAARRPGDADAADFGRSDEGPGGGAGPGPGGFASGGPPGVAAVIGRRSGDRPEAAGGPTGGAAEPGGTGPGPIGSPGIGGAAASEATSLTLDELAQASGMPLEAVTELEHFGLVVGRRVGSFTYYDPECVEIARLAARFRAYGVEARHLRMYRTTVEREAALFEQVVTPMLKQRNPHARKQAIDSLLELASLGDAMRAAVLRQALRDYTGGP